MEAAQIFFTEIHHATEHAVALCRNNDVAENAPDAWSAEVYFEQKPEIGPLENAIAEHFPAWANVPPGQLEEIPDTNWVAHSLEGLGIVRAGRFVLYGIHDADKLPTDEENISIRIDANQAFGTGHHPTTEGCLTLLDRFAGFAPKNILDLGCGSAILSIAAAKLWNRDVLATDIDADSITIAAENAEQNEVGDQIATFVADGFSHAEIENRAPFDFIFANILAGPLKEFAPEMAAHTRKNGRVMLAGLMADQEAAVLAAYADAGFRLINRLDHATWPVLLLVRT